MVDRRIDIPNAWQTKAPETREDLRRVRHVLERLRSQMAELEGRVEELEENPGGGGGTGDLTGVAEGSGINITDPGGPVPTIAVDFGTGGGQVRQANDAAYTDARTPTGPAGGDLTGTYPNPTIPGLSGEIWRRPASPNAWNEEFDGSIGSMSWWQGDPNGAGPLTAATGAAGTVDDYSADPAAGNVRYSVSRRNSWLQWNVPVSGTVRMFALKQATLDTDDSFDTRINPLIYHDNNNNNSLLIGLIIMADSGGSPSTQDWAAIQIDTDPGQYAASRFQARVGGAALALRPLGTAQTYTSTNNVAGSVMATPWQYMGIRKRGTSWCMYMGTDGFVRTTNEFTGAQVPNFGATVWVGLMSWRASGADGTTIFSADYARRGVTLPW